MQTVIEPSQHNTLSITQSCYVLYNLHFGRKLHANKVIQMMQNLFSINLLETFCHLYNVISTCQKKPVCCKI